MIIIDSIKRYMRRRKEDREFQQMAYSIIAEMNKKNALSHNITRVIVDKAVAEVSANIRGFHVSKGGPA